MVKCFGPALIVCNEVKLLGELGIQEFIKKHNLDISLPVMKIVNSPKSCKESTMNEYGARWEELKLFAFLRGDY